jgi:hypothetical protein
VNTTNDVNHCGSCNKVCSGATCESSACTIRYGYQDVTGLGSPSIEPFNSNYLLGERIYIGSSIIVTKIALNALVASSYPHVAMALYTDSGTAPSQLLASTASTTLVAGANEIPVLVQASIPAGNYWIMAVYDGGAQIASDSATDNTFVYVSFNFSTTMPTPFPSSISSYTSEHAGYYVVGTQ